MFTEKQDFIEEHVIDVINANRTKSKRRDSTSILEYINKNFESNAEEIYVNNIIPVLLDQNKILKKKKKKKVIFISSKK